MISKHLFLPPGQDSLHCFVLESQFSSLKCGSISCPVIGIFIFPISATLKSPNLGQETKTGAGSPSIQSPGKRVEQSMVVSARLVNILLPRDFVLGVKKSQCVCEGLTGNLHIRHSLQPELPHTGSSL